MQQDEQNSEELSEWLKRVSEEEMPALTATMRGISSLNEDDNRPLSELADIILQDPAMTSHVLRRTNSAYRLRHNKMNSVSRALVMLGFDEVKSICLTAAVFGQVKKAKPHDMLLLELERAFRAATLAREMNYLRGEPGGEEVFIATLMSRLGPMVFWCFGGEDAEKLEKALEEDPETPEEDVEKAVLGFELSSLTAPLVSEWGLGDKLEKALSGEEESAKWKSVFLSAQFILAAEQGFDQPDAQELRDELAEFCGMDTEKFDEFLEQNQLQALDVAREFGVDVESMQIQDQSSESTANETAAADDDESTAILEPDPMFQLKVLREVPTLVEVGADVHSVLELFLEGIYRGLGMDCAVFAILNTSRTMLFAKSVMGFDRNWMLEKFRFELNESNPNVFQQSIATGSGFLVPSAEDADYKHLLPEEVTSVVGTGQFMAVPTMVKGKAIGVFYADRRHSNAPT